MPQDLVSLGLFLVFGLSRRRARRRTENCRRSTTRFSSIDRTTSLWGSTAKVADFLWCLGDGAYTSFWSSRGADGRTRIKGFVSCLRTSGKACTAMHRRLTGERLVSVHQRVHLDRLVSFVWGVSCLRTSRKGSSWESA